MKILVVDREAIVTQLIRSRLEAQGHTVIEEPSKNNIQKHLEQDDFDVVMFDPAPLNDARPVVLSARRYAKNYPYIVLLSQNEDPSIAIRAGVNDMMVKPLGNQHLDTVIANAERMVSLVNRMGDESEDFPSAGGVIAKSAFNQLFLSSLDRADRYGEKTFLLFIGMNNFKEVIDMDGPYAAEYTSARLSQSLVRLRRQSDIIAQTGKGEYCLMLQRIQHENEPVEAAKRFAEAITNVKDMRAPETDGDIEIYVSLVHIPSGEVKAAHDVIVAKGRP